MGDVVMITPILRCLKLQLSCEVHVLTKSQYEPLLLLPFVDQIHFLETDRNILVKQLKVLSFDYVVDLHNNLRSRILCWHLQRPTVRTKKDFVKKWILLKLRVNLLQKKHVIDRHFKCVKSLGVRNDGLGIAVPVKREQYYYSTTRPQISIAIGGTYLTKRVPVRIVNEIIKAYPQFTINILGGDDVVDSSHEIVKSDHVKNYTGSTTLEETIQLICDSEILITGDTGLMHIGAALQKKILVIWGSTTEDFGFAPYFGNHKDHYFKIEEKNMTCRPCSKYGRSACPKGHMNCLNKISTNDVVLLTRQMLKTNYDSANAVK